MPAEICPQPGGMIDSAAVRDFPLYDAFGVLVSDDHNQPAPSQPGLEDTALAQDKALLSQLAEYARYLYEEENKRRDVLNRTTKIFLACFGAVASIGLAKPAALEAAPATLARLAAVPPWGLHVALLGAALLLASAGLLCASFIFTILVLKMWKWERLCDPRQLAIRAMTMPGESHLLSAMVADYVVAANRNHGINEQKARLLSKALFSFIFSFVMFLSTWALLRGVEAAWR